MVRALGAAPASRVLDAACGLGQLAMRLQREGCQPFGVDGEFSAALYVRRKSSVPVVVGEMTRLPFRNAVFDAITSGETLEHLDDDAAAARELARVLRARGRCVVTVPAVQSLWTASDVYFEHRRRYSRDELAALFRDAGLQIERVAFWGFPLVLAYDFLFLLPVNKRRRRQGSLTAVGRAGRSRILVSVVRAIFSLDRLFAWIPFGPGLLAVATKR